MKKQVSLILSLVLLLGLLSGCGSSATSETTYKEMMVESPMAPAMSAADRGVVQEEAADNAAASTLPESRKWIITMNLSVETDDLDKLTAALTENIAAVKGYIEDQSVYNGSMYNSSRRYRSANLTVRVPADQVDAFTQNIGGIANVVRTSRNVQDVTLSYIATESRLKALQTEESRLLELLAKAETMSDLLEIEGRLTDVRSELENVASQKRVFDNQIDYATVSISIQEVQEYTPVEEPTLWERIRKGFLSNLKGLGSNLLDAFVWFLTSLPYLVVLALVVFVVVVILRRRKAKRAAKKQENSN